MKLKLPSGETLFFCFVVAILLWLIAIPLLQMLVNSFRTGHPAVPGPFTIKNYLAAYGTPLTYRMIFNTLIFASGGTAITLSIAVLFAWLLERTDMPLQSLLDSPVDSSRDARAAVFDGLRVSLHAAERRGERLFAPAAQCHRE